MLSLNTVTTLFVYIINVSTHMWEPFTFDWFVLKSFSDQYKKVLFCKCMSLLWWCHKVFKNTPHLKYWYFHFVVPCFEGSLWFCQRKRRRQSACLFSWSLRLRFECVWHVPNSYKPKPNTSSVSKCVASTSQFKKTSKNPLLCFNAFPLWFSFVLL